MKKLSILILIITLTILSYSQMPDAITIEPPDATVYDELTLYFDPTKACSESGSLIGLTSIAIHSGLIINGVQWQNVIGYDGTGVNGQPTTLFPTGDGRFSITYTPSDFYGLNGESVLGICAVFNNGTDWSQDGRDFAWGGIECKDFIIPLSGSAAGWFMQESNTTANKLTSVQFINENLGWVVGTDNHILKTENGGNTWTIRSAGSNPPYHFHWRNVCFSSEEVGMISGYLHRDGSGFGRYSIITNDGGETFDDQHQVAYFSFNHWTDACIINNTAWKLASDGRLHNSTEGLYVYGYWTMVFDAPSGGGDMFFLDEDIGWIVGSQGYLGKTSDGGYTFEQIEVNTSMVLVAVYFTDQNKGFVSGWDEENSNHVFLRTTDGGQSWVLPNYPEDIRYLNSIYFANDNQGWACGSKFTDAVNTDLYKGIVIYTDDGGESWVEQGAFDGTTHFRDIYFVSESVGWVVGDGGYIFKTISGGGAPSYIKEQPEFLLTNSYPNPFTTSTTLPYTLYKPENVQFTVYNVQSQIVYIMKERQDKGEQKIEWNAEGLPAGMYYFRIQAGDKAGGGKMVKMD